MIPANLSNHLWQSTLFAAAAGLLTLALRNHRAPVRYWLWFTASVKFLVPFALLVSLGSHVEWRKTPAPAPIPIVTAPLPSVIEQISQPFPPLPANTPRTPINLPAVLLCLWSCGFSIVVFGWARQWLRLRTALRSASPVPLNLPIRAMSSPSRLEPGVFGVFRPVLLLPEGIADRLAPAQWDAILAHELCHVRRRDNLTASIHMAVEAIFWFHPLVWWIGKRLIAERERACDEAVLLAVHHPQDYAEGILNVCKLCAESPLACVSGITGSNLKKRIRAIMTEPIAADLHFAKKLALALAGIAALAAPIAVGLVNAPPLQAQVSTQSPPTQTRPAQSPQAPPAQPPPPAPRILAQNQPDPAPVNPGARVIAANDVLSIDVPRERDWTKLYTVEADGTVRIPLVGGLKAAGLTTLQLQQQLTGELSQFMRSPEVFVAFWEGHQRYYVVGPVKRPGEYLLVQPITVLDALREAGGFSPDSSNQTDIVIMRRGGQSFHFNYEDYLKGQDQDMNIALQAFDVIQVK
jgi:beta-lactamase regulating signal transducer with metallopeptidase domain/protein involved in polysaccharide export with SLBB domain